MSFAFAGEDIVFKTQFDLNSSKAMIEQLRILFKNNGFGDPYSQEIKKPISIDLTQVLNDVPSDTQRWIRELQSVLSLKLFESDYKLKVYRFNYYLEEFNSEFTPSIGINGRLEYVTKSYVRGLQLGADKISLEVELKRAQTHEPLIFSIDIIKPQFIVGPELVADLTLHWSTELIPNFVNLKFNSLDLSSLITLIARRPDLIDLKTESIEMPQVSVRVGSKEVKFDESKIDSFLTKNKEGLKKGIIDIFNARMKDRLSNIFKDNPKLISLPRKIPFDGDAPAILSIEKMLLVKNNILDIRLNGLFCKKNVPLDKEICATDAVSVRERRRIDEESFLHSLEEMDKNLTARNKNMALSVSEKLLNQLVAVTIRSGLWDKPLSKYDLILGPEQGFILAEKNGDISLYMDVILKLTRSQSILTGRSQIRFPLKFSIQLQILDIHEVPHLEIKVAKVETNPANLITGFPQHGLPTTVASVPRFRNKVINIIMASVSTYAGDSLLEIKLKELKGTYLHKIQFFSDGHGRVTGVLGF